MKNMGANLKLSDGILTIDSAGVSVDVETLESAHIAGSIVTQKKHEIALLTLENNRQILESLHKQFGHFSGAKLKDPLKSAGKQPQEVLESVDRVCEECSKCQKSGRN